MVRLTRTAVSRFRAGEATLESTGTAPMPALDVLQESITTHLAARMPNPDAARALASRIARSGYAAAQSLSDGSLQATELSEESLANLEAVIRVTDRPAWFVQRNRPQIAPGDRLGDFWIARLGTMLASVRAVCSSVACISKDVGAGRIAIGTGWLVCGRTLITNAHVGQHLAYRKPGASATPSGGWRLRSDVRGEVDFRFEHGSEATLRTGVEQVLYVEASDTGPDMAFFRLEPFAAGQAPPAVLPLDLQARAGADVDVFTVGHPIADLQDDANVAAVFGDLDGTKRWSPGRITAALREDVVAHDCSTTNGSSGSPVVDLATLRAVALHYFGLPGDRNEALFLPALKEHMAVRRCLADEWGF